MKEKFNQENTPNAGKLMSSLRYSGYENKVAISDLIDNSLDAEASTVEVTISGDQKLGKATIVIRDDGNGMDKDTLAQALRLGSLTNRDVDSDLGRFGMGLVTGSISIAKRIEVYTRTEGSSVLVGIMDLDNMESTNSFDIHRDIATSEQEKIAKEYGLGNHGTVVVLTKCDQLERVQTDEFENALRNKLGEIYRYFIRSGKKIIVNGKVTNIIDPMWLDGRYVEEYGFSSNLEFDKTFDIRVSSGETKQFTVKVYRLPDELPVKEMRKLGITQDTQGFYVLRNYRQVATGNDLRGIWKRHNSLNRVRVELLVSGHLDSLMGINYTKHNVNPSQVILDKLVNEVMPEVDRLRKRYPRKNSSVASTELDFSEAETFIKQKSKLLDKATFVEPEKKSSANRKEHTGVVEVSAYKVGAHQRGLASLADSARFENEDLGSSGPIFHASKDGRTTIITWNNSHPFFQKVLFTQRDEQELVNAVSFLAYALGEAKLKYSTPETEKLLNEVIDTMSRNLKVLLD